MYNRYIPQNDGSYRRSRVPDNSRPQQPRPMPTPTPHPAPQPEIPCEPVQQARRECPKKQPSENANVGSFLRQLLPKDFDTGDLIVVLLLLLMAGDCREDQSTALLTLALYLFL